MQSSLVLGRCSVRKHNFFRHLAQSTSACLTAMTQGDLTSATLGHWQIAVSTGLAVGLTSVVLSFGKLARIEATRWGIALVALVGTSVADLVMHPTHFGSWWTESLVTGLGAAALSLLVSYTPLNKAIAKIDNYG